MKNFSTVGVRFAVSALFAGLLAAPAQAGTCEFRPNAPDQHLVVKGDTLWDLSGTFLEHPWCWPQVWGMNKEEIRNPHWIYPGQTIYFDRVNKRLSLHPPGSGDGDGERAIHFSGDVINKEFSVGLMDFGSPVTSDRPAGTLLKYSANGVPIHEIA